ncbi:MAG: thioredoxin domain-containing protein [Candidatus Magasanikbacteria bacterium]|nr:thioredoxin domain-containing protein [Candidatus Magasanikbacteria bacterium]
MEENFTSQTNAPDTTKQWYRKGWGIAVLTMLGLILVVGLLFAGFFAYYAWQLRFGDAGEVTGQFKGNEKKMSVSQFLSGAKNTGDFVSDYAKYIRPSNPVIGDAAAPVMIIVFEDFECSYCREAFPVFKEVARKYESVIRVVFKHLPLVSAHPDSLVAAEASACAQEQGKFLEYRDLLFTGQDLSSAALSANAQALGLNTDMFNLCLATEKYNQEINRDIGDAVEIGLEGTPSYLVNGVKIGGVLTARQWDEVILSFLNKTK